MTQAEREQLATPVVLVYWLMITGGLLIYGALRLDDYASVIPLWLGAVGGTLLGQLLALRDFRMWIAVLVVLGVTGLGLELVPPVFAGAVLWQAFVPAALCGFWSLGDRSVLAAVWFPAVLWMLSILDRTDGSLAPDGTGVVLLAVLAALFIALLRARETRRVALWRAVAAVPLAPAGPVELLRTPPASQLARAGWGLSVSAITVGITAWVVPPLWEVEPIAGEAARIADPGAPPGLPCCPRFGDAELESSRVKEYLDLGRGHDAHALALREGIDCRSCDAYADDAEVCELGGPRVTTPSRPGAGGAWRSGSGGSASRQLGPGGWSGSRAGAGGSRSGTSDGSWSSARAGTGGSASYGSHADGGSAWSARAGASDAAREAGRPTAPPAVAFDPRPTTQAQPAPVPAVESKPRPAPAFERPSRTAPAAPQPAAPVSRAPGPAAAAPHATAHGVGPSLAHWLLLLGAGALIFQLVGLALRPLRRLITLRHLRRPFWDETIAQRVSNAWQLALVGLRDAGWRPGASEAPHELARRVGVDGLDRCATILERARHGIGLDADDLGEMASSADRAYRAARTGLGPVARAIGWLRWPLA